MTNLKQRGAINTAQAQSQAGVSPARVRSLQLSLTLSEMQPVIPTRLRKPGDRAFRICHAMFRKGNARTGPAGASASRITGHGRQNPEKTAPLQRLWLTRRPWAPALLPYLSHDRTDAA